MGEGECWGTRCLESPLVWWYRRIPESDMAQLGPHGSATHSDLSETSSPMLEPR